MKPAIQQGKKKNKLLLVELICQTVSDGKS